MAGNYGKQIILFGVDLSKFESREEALAITIAPPKELVPTPVKTLNNLGWKESINSYHGQPSFPSGPSISRSMHAPSTNQVPMMRKLAGEKRLFGQLDPKPIIVGKDLNILPPKTGETLVDVVSTKDRDVSYVKYCQVKP